MKNTKKLTDICDFQGGSQPPKNEWSDSPKDGYIRMLQIRDFTQDREDKQEFVKITNSTKTCNKDDILIARYGASIGKILTGLSGAYNVAIMKTIPDESIISKRYLMYFLFSDLFQLAIKNVGSRAAQAGFNKNDLEKILIDVPSIEEQNRIVSLLDKADEIRAKKKLANDKLDEFLKSTFISMFGDPVNDKTIPKEHLEKYLVYVQNGISRRRKIPQNIGEIVFRIKEIRENYIDYSDINRIPLDDKEKDKYRININELLFIRVNGNKDYVGRNTVFRGYNEDTFFNDHIMRVKINESELNPIYLSRFLNLPFGKEEIKKYVKTSAGQFTINQHGLGSVELPIPPIEDQNKFAQIVEKVEAQKQKNEQVIEQMDNLFNSLSQRAFKGEL